MEYREKLDVNSPIEKEWLNELESKYFHKIKSKMNNDMVKYHYLIDSILNEKIEITKDYILEIINNTIK